MKRTAPVLITDAPLSPEQELKRRERRYITMMAARALCLILGVVLVMLRVPLLVIWLPLCGLGMVLLPWLAVIIANDRPPKDKHRLKRYRGNTTPGRALPAEHSEPAADRQPGTFTGKVIDADQ